MSDSLPGVFPGMIGQTVSHYRVLSQLGGGGMGVVYEPEAVNLAPHFPLNTPPNFCRFEGGGHATRPHRREGGWRRPNPQRARPPAPPPPPPTPLAVSPDPAPQPPAALAPPHPNAPPPPDNTPPNFFVPRRN